jgi:hypothetical protein
MSLDNLPVNIQPEAVLIANTYLESGCDIRACALALDVPAGVVSNVVASRPVREYVHSVLRASMMRKMDTITAAMDNIIAKKLEELDSLEMTSSKDIADLLQMQHKMLLDQAKMATTSSDKDVSVTQINNVFDNTAYGDLMKRIVNA